MPSESEIRAYWQRKAAQLGTDPAATMKDVILRSLELEAIATRLRPDDTLLDVGCGNAWGSLILAEHCASVHAVDYSSEMVEAARRAIAASGRGNVTTDVADVREVGALGRRFRAACSIRCLINLPDADDQRRAIDAIAAALEPGGRLFLIEGVAEGFAGMNALRERAGLPPIALNWHNKLLPQASLHAWLAAHFDLEETVDFGEYYFLSRVVHPLLVAPAEPAFDGALNQVAKALWQTGALRGRLGDLSTLVLHVARKR